MTTADQLLQSEQKLTDELITHESIMRQLLLHEGRIIQNMNSLKTVSDDLSAARKDISEIKYAVTPVLQAIKSLCWLLRAILVMGTLAAASVAFMEFYDHLPMQ